LTTAGVSTGAVVAVVMRQRPALLAAELATLSLGRPAVLVSPLQGDRALVADLVDLAPAVVVAGTADWVRPGVTATVEAAGPLGLVVGDDLSLDVAVPTSSPPAGPRLDAAVTVQTSGTTGPPKRHPVPWSTFATLGGGPPGRAARSDRGAMILALPLVTLGGLLSVARLVFGGRPLSMMERFDVHTWAGLVKEHRPSVIGAPPPVVKMILDADVSPDHFDGVTAYVTSSAAVPVDVARRFEARYGIPVLVGYGATEFLGSVTVWTPALWTEFGPIKAGSAGRAVPGARLRVLAADSLDDAEPREVPVGEEGVLEVDPPQRAGHLPPGWLRTNDRARLDADGFLWVLGRADDVIIRGGFKVDLGAVADAIRRHPLVFDAACVGLSDDRVGTVPGALVAAHPEAPLTEADVREHLRELVAPYAIPTVIRFAATIPRTETLKPHQVVIREQLTAG
jgi:acyl-CoA synthetase (AMP-forming)/AMP-acid ligase II